MTIRERLAEAVALWRRSQPGGAQRRGAADLIEALEAELFGGSPHALGRLIGDDNEGYDRLATRREDD